MTVKIKDSTRKTYAWTGLSSDPKPETGVPDGSMFHCVDTGEEYIFHDGMWEDDLRTVLNKDY